jgi:hypothetical protein
MLVARNHEIAGSVPTGSSNKFEVKKKKTPKLLTRNSHEVGGQIVKKIFFKHMKKVSRFAAMVNT